MSWGGSFIGIDEPIMSSSAVHWSTRPVSCFSSSIRSIGNRSTTLSRRCFPNLVCCCAHEDTDEAATWSTSSLGRREALVSLVAGVSITPASSGFDEVSFNEGRVKAALVHTAQGKENVVTSVSNFGVATEEGVTSNYVRPAGASPNLPLDSLLPTSRELLASTPTQVYVSLYGPNHMTVSWITSGSGESLSGSGSTVDYGTSAGNYTATAKSSKSSYKYGSYTSGNIHYAVIGPLDDDATYFYRVGGVGGPEFSCKTPPAAGPDVPIKFVVVGDLGQTSNTQSTLDHFANSSYDVLILPGDLSYADGDQPLWDSYGQLVSPLASSRPWMVTQGNHEVESASHTKDFTAYNARWKMPYELSGSDNNLFYSFEVAGVHVLMLGSYTDFSKGSDQYKWLQKDLAKVDRSKTPWLIAVVHAPWYNSNFAHQGDGSAMLKAMEDLLFGAKVDIMFAGHVHAYERAVRTYKGKPNSCGILYLNIGDGGNREGLAPVYLPQPNWSAFREASYGHGELTINSSSTAVWTWHRNQDDEAIIADSVTITSLSSSGQC